MKRLVSLLATFLIAISGSISAFAISSPGGEIKPDQFNIVGTVTKGEEKFSDVIVTIGDKNATTNKNGSYRIEALESGDHTIYFKTDDKVLGSLRIKIEKGKTTGYEKLADGSYLITVASNIITLNIDFSINDDGVIKIIKVSPAGNDSPTSPPSGDMMPTISVLALIISFTGIVICSFFKKRYSF